MRDGLSERGILQGVDGVRTGEYEAIRGGERAELRGLVLIFALVRDEREVEMFGIHRVTADVYRERAMPSGPLIEFGRVDEIVAHLGTIGKPPCRREDGDGVFVLDERVVDRKGRRIKELIGMCGDIGIDLGGLDREVGVWQLVDAGFCERLFDREASLGRREIRLFLGIL